MASTFSQIKRYFSSLPPGTLISTRELLPFGKRGSVDWATHTLVNRQIIERLAQGVFRLRLPGNKPVSVAKIAEFKARIFGRVLVSSGTVLPEDIKHMMPGLEKDTVVFAISGRTSAFRTSKNRVVLLGMSKRKIALGNSEIGKAMRDLWFVGKRNRPSRATFEDIEPLVEKHKRALPWYKPLMPQWQTDRYLYKQFLHPLGTIPKQFHLDLWSVKEPLSTL